MATMTETVPMNPDRYKLELMSAYGPVYREVLRTPARDCNSTEVPMIDLANINGTKEQRRELADTVKEAAENTGFFYIKNHGIPPTLLAAALAQAKTFFAQSEECKEKVSTDKSKYFNGWARKYATNISPTDKPDKREGFSFRYDPRHDPETKDLEAIPEDVRKWLKVEDHIWDGTSHLPNFKDELVMYWQACITLARQMIKIFALAMGAPEDYFDKVVTYPGSDCVFNYYPKNESPTQEDVDVGLGAHTDLQCFTFLWQDDVGGLQVLTKEGQWIKVPPVVNTYVVNIGDFMHRLSNERFTSTVHRVYNTSTTEDRYSMPFFFGLNHNEKCEVVPSCTSETDPAKHEPISCGEWYRLRFENTFGAKYETK